MSANFIFAHLRAALARALTHPENLAFVRLPESEQTVAGLARAYLPRYIRTLEGDVSPLQRALGWFDLTRGMWALDLGDPSTAHAVLVALALALGLDPGPLGLGVMWVRLDSGGWRIATPDGSRAFCGLALHGWYIVAPTVATEPDPARALALALLHVLGGADV